MRGGVILKLNNRGWGLKEMLLLSSILIFFFCVAIYFIYILYDSIDKDVRSNNAYVEEKIEEYE